MAYYYDEDNEELQQAVKTALLAALSNGILVGDGAGGISARAILNDIIQGSTAIPNSNAVFKAINKMAHYSVTSVKYAVSNTQTEPSDPAEWSDTIPAVADGQYLWVKFIWADGEETVFVAKQGATGADATVTETKYGISSSVGTQPTSWQDTIPAVSGGDFLWTRLKWNNNNYTYIVARQGSDAQGDMKKADYDASNTVLAAGGIPAFTDAEIYARLRLKVVNGKLCITHKVSV